MARMLGDCLMEDKDWGSGRGLTGESWEKNGGITNGQREKWWSNKMSFGQQHNNSGSFNWLSVAIR